MIDYISIFLLGIAVIIHPCTAAPNVAAMSYLWASSPRRATALWMYIVGHALAYGILATTLTALLRFGIINLSHDTVMEWGAPVLAAVLAVGGVTLIFSGLHSHHHHHTHTNKMLTSPMGAFVSGACLAMLFCPEASLAFFGVLVPMSGISMMGYTLPWLFAVATALPMIALLVLLQKGKHVPEKWLNTSSKRFNITMGCIFIVAALFVVLL